MAQESRSSLAMSSVFFFWGTLTRSLLYFVLLDRVWCNIVLVTAPPGLLLLM